MTETASSRRVRMSQEARQLFIGGCSRSGTTFLGDQLGRATGYVVIPESQFKERLLTVNFQEEQSRKRAIRTLLGNWRLAHWNVDDHLTEQEFAGAKSLSAVMDILVDAYCMSIGERRSNWIDHTPTNINILLGLNREFSKARFIHLIRDPRAVWASVRRLNWGPNTVFSFIPWWSRAIGNGLSGERVIANHMIRVKYEDVCRNSAEWMTKIIDRLDLDTFQGAEHRQRGFKVPAYTRFQHQWVGGPPRTEHIDNWKTLLPSRDIEVIEAELRSEMQNFDYAFINNYPLRRATVTEVAMEYVKSGPASFYKKLVRNLQIATLTMRRKFNNGCGS